jgi:hypothetical protein
VGNLISAPSEKELGTLQKIYTPDFAATVCAEGGNEETKLRRCLKKMGLLFVNGEIISLDQEHKRWNHVSMLARVGTKMPSTSNTIESLNCRLNGKTPRFNVFWRSMQRIREAIMQKIDNFTDCMRYNHKYDGHIAQRRFNSVPWARMDREIAFFLSTDDTCLYGETVLATEIYQVDCPCSHRFGLIAEINRVSSVQGVRAILEVLSCRSYFMWFCMSFRTGLSAISDPELLIGWSSRQAILFAKVKLNNL